MAAVLVAAAPATFVSGGQPGPIQVGTSLYIIVQKNGALNPMNFNVYKSVDNGVTWAQAGGDSANSNNANYSVCAVGSIIYVICETGTTGGNHFVQFIPFDTATDSFGAAIVTTALYAGSGTALANSFFPSAYRASDNSIIFCNVVNTGGLSIPFYCVFNVGTLTAGTQVQCGDLVTTIDWTPVAVLQAGAFTHFMFQSSDSVTGETKIYAQTLSATNVLGIVQTLDTAPNNVGMLGGTTDGTTVVMGWIPAFPYVLTVYSGASAEPVVFTQQTVAYTEGNHDLNDIAFARNNGITFAIAFGNPGGHPNNPDGYYQDSGTGYGAFTVLNAAGLYRHPRALNLGGPLLWGIVAAGSIVFFGFGSGPPPPPLPGPATIKKNVPEPALLPDPRVLCCKGQQIQKVQLDGRFMTFQSDKGVVGKYAIH